MSGRKCKYFLTIGAGSVIIRTIGLEYWLRTSMKVIKLNDDVGQLIWDASDDGFIWDASNDEIDYKVVCELYYCT